MAKSLRMVELSFTKCAVDKPNLPISSHPKALERFFVYENNSVIRRVRYH
jgi:hypothetical protein